VLGRIRVLDKSILRVQESRDSCGNLAAVDEVVENNLRRGVLQEVAAIVYYQQRIRRSATEPSRQIQGHLTIAVQSVTFDEKFG
jgi:hypothetical protein